MGIFTAIRISLLLPMALGCQTKTAQIAPELDLQSRFKDQLQRGTAEGYVESLRRNYPTDYILTMQEWCNAMAQETRSENQLPPASDTDYGLMNFDFSAMVKQPFKIPQPIILKQFIDDLNQNSDSTTAKVVANLLIIYAQTEGRYKDILLKPMLQLIQNKPRMFVEAFRRESPVVQIGALSLLEKAKFSGAIAELLWLSQYHKSTSLKALARNKLDSLVTPR